MKRRSSLNDLRQIASVGWQDKRECLTENVKLQ
jgi:hypothetical protein